MTDSNGMTGLTRYLTEAQFTNLVVDMAHLYGWHVVHFRPALTKQGWRTAIQGDRGFVDVVLARGGRVLHVELKTMHGAMRPGQKEWAEQIGDTYRLWRPSDMETIKQELRPDDPTGPGGTTSGGTGTD